jgi:hypothetical protein
MPLDTKLQHQASRMLAVVDEAGTKGVRLQNDARRLWSRVRRFIGMNLVPPEMDQEAMELACIALQLPMRQGKVTPAGKLGQVSLRERAEQAAELLISELGPHAPEELVDRAVRLLREMHQRSPMMDEAKLLADAVNLDDFGVTGLVLQALMLGRLHCCVKDVGEGFEKRTQYGYWEARLKDGFHFEPIRQIARLRLEKAKQVADLLLGELREDQAL